MHAHELLSGATDISDATDATDTSDATDITHTVYTSNMLDNSLREVFSS